jgi:hypothetical protein
MKRLAITALALLGGMVALTAAQAAVLSGRVGVSSYLWERSELDTTETRHWQNTGTVSLRLTRIADQDLSISTSLRGRYDSRNRGDNADDYRVYHFNVRWRKIADRVDLEAGRHRVYWPTGTVNIDGGSAEARVWRGLSAGGYFGVTPPEDGRLKLTDYDEGHALGARLSVQCRRLGRVTVAFAERRLARSYVVDDETVEVDNLVSQRIGLDWRRPIAGFGTAYGQLTYQMPTHRIGRLHLSARWKATPTVSVHGQFRYRRPDIAYNSIFWVFGPTRYYEARLRANIRVNPTWTVNIGGTYVDLVDDNTQRFDIGLSHQYFTVMIHGKAGGSGSTIGLTGSALYPINDRWLLRGGARYSSYELIEDQEESSWETSIWGGARWNWMTQSSIELEAQFLSQDVTTQKDFAGDETDFRLLARISWWFSNRLGS